MNYFVKTRKPSLDKKNFSFIVDFIIQAIQSILDSYRYCITLISFEGLKSNLHFIVLLCNFGVEINAVSFHEIIWDHNAELNVIKDNKMMFEYPVLFNNFSLFGNMYEH